MEEISTRIIQGCNSIDCYNKLIGILGTQDVKYIKEQICDQPNVMRDLENFIIEGNEGIIGRILSSQYSKLIKQLINTNSKKTTQKPIFLQKLEGFINGENESAKSIIGKILSSRCSALIRRLINEKDCDFVGKLEELIANGGEVSERIIRGLNANIKRYKDIDELKELISIIKSNKAGKEIRFTGVINAVRELYEKHKSALSAFSAVKDQSTYQVEDSSLFDDHILPQPMVQQPYYIPYPQPIVQQQYVYQPININVLYQSSYPQQYYPSCEQPQTFTQTDLHDIQLQRQRAKLETESDRLTSSEIEFEESLEQSSRRRKAPETNNDNTNEKYLPKIGFDDSMER